LALRIPKLNSHILILDVPGFGKHLAEYRYVGSARTRRSGLKNPDYGHRRLLRTRRERPRRRRAADKRDEFASPHGRPSSDLGRHITMPLRKNAGVHHSKNCALLSQMGLGCVKTPALAADVRSGHHPLTEECPLSGAKRTTFAPVHAPSPAAFHRANARSPTLRYPVAPIPKAL
jgi:hypothetical protein